MSLLQLEDGSGGSFQVFKVEYNFSRPLSLRACFCFLKSFRWVEDHWHTWDWMLRETWHWCYHSTEADTPRTGGAGTWGQPGAWEWVLIICQVCFCWCSQVSWSGLSLFSSSPPACVWCGVAGDHQSLEKYHWWFLTVSVCLDHVETCLTPGSWSSLSVLTSAPEPREYQSHWESCCHHWYHCHENCSWWRI